MKNFKTMLLWGAIASLALQSACQNPVEPEDSTDTIVTRINGTVIRSDNLAPVANAIVSDLNGIARDTSKADGSFSLRYQLTSTFVGRVFATRSGFGNDTVNVNLVPGRDTTITLKLTASAGSPGTGGTSAASIVLIGATETNIAIRGSGLNETATLTFEVRDSLGIPVGATNRANVSFQIQGGPGGGEYIFPVSQESDALTGRVTTKVTSGTKAGVLQVVASASVGGRALKSSPVRVTISGGLPVQERFTISLARFNVPGLVVAGIRNSVTVFMGDKDGNPVQAGTAVYFTTTGGYIQPVGTTNADGIASVDLITGNPNPPGGIAWIIARTIGENGADVRDSAAVVFSGRPLILIPQGSFEVLDGGTYTFNYIVSDINGNPLTRGARITVTASGPGSGDLELSGDTQVNLPDTQSPAFTQFTVTLRDRVIGGASGQVRLKIDVTGDNGNTSADYLGTVREREDVVEVPPSAKQPAQIRTFPPSATSISVAGVGGVENSVLTYQVLDSLGVPVDTSAGVVGRFSIQFFPNSFVGGGTPPRVIPDTARADLEGKFRASIVSGTQAGVVQLVARVNLPSGGVLYSEPVRVTVHGGFPDQNHFTLTTSNFAFAGLDFVNQIDFTVLVGDTFSNPVPAGTAIYWNSQAGVMQTGNTPGASYTAANGVATSVLYTGNPRPIVAPFFEPSVGPGYHWVWAQTQGRGGAWIRDSVLVLVCGGPISITGLPASFTIPKSGTSTPMNFEVRDGLNNPLPTGTTVRVSIAFDNSLTGIKFVPGGDFSEQQPVHTVPNTGFARFPGPKVTSYVVRVQDASTGGAPTGMSVTLTVTVTAPGIGSSSVSIPGSVQ
jgi:hypothetical protein